MDVAAPSETATDAGRDGAGDGYTPISALRVEDERGVPALLGERVTVRGIVTVPSGVFSAENNELYVQDSGAAVSVYEEGGRSLVAALGDDVEVTGTVASYAGKTELRDPAFVLLGAGSPVPEPAEATTADLCERGERYEALLVRLRGLRIVGGEGWPEAWGSGNFNLVVDDGSGPCALRIDHHTELNGSPRPEEPFEAVGVVKQYDESPPYDEGYELQPRFLSDLR